MILPIFSQTGDTQFGSFHYPLGLLEFDISAKGREGFERIRRGERFTAADGDEDALTQLAYEMMSLFHEMRHFVDMFGTVAGCALFGGYVARLKEFAEISGIMREAGMRWKFPIVKWSGENDCPVAVRKFIRQARAFSVGVDLFITPFNPVEIEGHCEDLLVELNYERGGKADAFPLRIGVIRDDKETLRTILFPIGLEALTEATAHALSRNLVGDYFPPSIAQRLEKRSATFDREDQATSERIAKQMAMLYMAVDLMISRFLQRHGIARYPRDLIFAVVDRVLSTAKIALIEVQPGSTALHCDRVGSMLLDILESEDPELLRAGTISDKSVLTSAYDSLVVGFESGGDWESVQDDRSPLSSVKIWESYVAKNFMLPLLRERVATKGRVFAKHNEFLGLINRIGLPPVRVADGKLVFGNMPERVQQAWVHQLMLGQILDLMVKEKTIFCPRAFSTFPGIDTLNFAFESDCDAHIQVGCGTFRPGQTATTIPNCLFEHALRVSALER
jgi:hypothetical protein